MTRIDSTQVKRPGTNSRTESELMTSHSLFCGKEQDLHNPIISRYSLKNGISMSKSGADSCSSAQSKNDSVVAFNHTLSCCKTCLRNCLGVAATKSHSEQNGNVDDTALLLPLHSPHLDFLMVLKRIRRSNYAAGTIVKWTWTGIWYLYLFEYDNQVTDKMAGCETSASPSGVHLKLSSAQK